MTVRRALFMAWVVTLASCRQEQAVRPDGSELVAVRKGDLRLTVRETGELAAKNNHLIKSGVEGQVSLIYLIPEGTEVKAGDRLIELDASSLIEERQAQAIEVENADAALVAAQQDMGILEKEIEADVAAAASELKIARIDLEKLLGRPAKAAAEAAPAAHDVAESAMRGQQQSTNADMVEALQREVVGMQYADLPDKILALLAKSGEGTGLDREVGELAQQVLKQLDEIKLAKGRLALAADKFNHSTRLAEKGYITGNELDRDRLEYETTRSQLVQAWNDLDLLISYSLQKDCIDLVQKVKNASLALEKVEASGNARRNAQEAELSSKQAEYALAKERLDNYDRQIAGAKIDAPTEGLVVYAEQGGHFKTEVVEEGMMVREGQNLIELPDVREMVVELKIPEAEIDRVVVNQRATIKVEAYPTVFRGTVTKVAPLPDSGSWWSASDVRVYKCEVALDAVTGDLRPGMSAVVEIAVGVVADVLSVPIAAVRRQGSVHYCWVETSEGPVARRVTIGAINLSEVEIKHGLRAQDAVYLKPPENVTAPRFEPSDAADQTARVEKPAGGR